jgi:hypothetical protein
MRLFAVLVASCALSQAAIAKAPECKSIADPGPRLACYDKVAPPSGEKSAAVRPAGPAPASVSSAKADPVPYIDTISAEDALMNARLKNICRGC